MSRIGKTPVTVPKEVTISQSARQVSVKGVSGELKMDIPAGVTVTHDGDYVIIELSKNAQNDGAIHGFVRANIANMVTGVTKGWTKTLELVGVGYRATMNGKELVLTVGYSHPVTITPPGGITFAVNEGKIVITGSDKQLVGQVAANIRSVREPEPYKGKGIKYAGERIRKKAGKSAKGATGGVAGK